jgi:hypothetical protein
MIPRWISLVSFEVASHHLMPMVLEGLARQEGLAHVNEGVLEIDIVLSTPTPRHSARCHSSSTGRSASRSLRQTSANAITGLPSAVNRSTWSNVRFSMTSASKPATGAARVFGIGADVRVGAATPSAALRRPPFPSSQDGPKRRCAGIVSDLTASVQKTELAHDTPSNSQRA